MGHRVWTTIATKRQDYIRLRFPNGIELDPSYRITGLGKQWFAASR
jgi:hypothetical protein